MLVKGKAKVNVYHPGLKKIVAIFDEYGLYETEEKEIIEFLAEKDGFKIHATAKTKKEYFDFVDFKIDYEKPVEDTSHKQNIEKAKKLGIARAGNMKPETLEQKIKDVESSNKE